MSFSDLIKKILGAAPEPDIKPVKPAPEKMFGDLEYELAKRKAREERERSREVAPGESPDLP